MHYYKASSLSTSHALNFHNLYKHFWYRKSLVVKEGKFGEEKDSQKPVGACTSLPDDTQRMSPLKERWVLRVSTETLLRGRADFRPTKLRALQSLRLCQLFLFVQCITGAQQMMTDDDDDNDDDDI